MKTTLSTRTLASSPAPLPLAREFCGAAIPQSIGARTALSARFFPNASLCGLRIWRRSAGRRYDFRKKNGSILVGVLWCMVLLSVLVIGVLHTARMDLLVVKNYGDRVQAHYLALAGIEKTRALLYRDAQQRSRNARYHSGELSDSAEQFRDQHLGRGQFRVFHRGR